MQELKPCPFCCGKAKLHKFVTDDIHGIFCPLCGTCYSNQMGENLEGVTAAWNKRVITNSINTEVTP